jgi:hypothetical protein
MPHRTSKELIPLNLQDALKQDVTIGDTVVWAVTAGSSSGLNIGILKEIVPLIPRPTSPSYANTYMRADQAHKASPTRFHQGLYDQRPCVLKVEITEPRRQWNHTTKTYDVIGERKFIRTLHPDKKIVRGPR